MSSIPVNRRQSAITSGSRALEELEFSFPEALQPKLARIRKALTALQEEQAEAIETIDWLADGIGEASNRDNLSTCWDYLRPRRAAVRRLHCQQRLEGRRD